MLSEKDGNQLLNFVRDTIVSKFTKLSVEIPKNPKFKSNSGIFVTLKKHGELRGCIGYPEPFFPLIDAAEKAAIAAAFDDPRFKPLQREEMENISIELSVLTEPELIKVESPKDYPNEIEIGVHGLIIKKEFNSGLLLPQVAVEYNWDSKEFLSKTCMKAMISPDAWLDSGTKIYRFECQIFSEKK
jgi:uncharacterized protein (TIGR00296 family)